MKIAINNSQTVGQVSLRQIRKLVEWLVPRLQRITPQQRWSEISFLLTDDAGICVVNQQYFGHYRPTDVISIPYDPLPGIPGTISGEVVVNVERALEVGAAHAGCDHEFALYLAHGCDHLAGSDDTDETGYRRMRRRELRWLRQAQDVGLIQGILCRS